MESSHQLLSLDSYNHSVSSCFLSSFCVLCVPSFLFVLVSSCLYSFHPINLCRPEFVPSCCVFLLSFCVDLVSFISKSLSSGICPSFHSVSSRHSLSSWIGTVILCRLVSFRYSVSSWLYKVLVRTLRRLGFVPSVWCRSSWFSSKSLSTSISPLGMGS